MAWQNRVATLGYDAAVIDLGPTMRRRQLGAELRQRRNAAGVSAEQAAALLDCARSRIGHIETGRNPIRKLELAALRDLYDMSEADHAALEELRKHASERGWWSTYKLPGWLQTYVGMEADARSIRNFEVEQIPGLLQTEAYARRLHIAAMGTSQPEEVERYVAARLRRQARLHDDQPPDYSAIISEAALRRVVADPDDIGGGQIQSLVEMGQRSHVAIHVLPYSAGLHPSMSGNFIVLGFDGVAPDVGYQEYAFGAHLVDDGDAVGRLTTLWDTLRSLSFSAEDTVQWMTQLRKI